MAGVTSTFKRLSPAYKALVALVAPICTILGMLLALNVISPFGEDALAAGIDQTAGAGTAAINVRVTGPDVAFDAAGDFDYRTRRALLNYDFSRTPGSESLTDVEAVFSRDQAYLKLGEGKRPWVHVDLRTANDDLAEFAEATGTEVPAGGLGSLGDLDLTDPSQALAQLRRAGEIEEVGSETIFSVPTTGYRGVIKPEKGGEPLTATAWIGPDDLIRRLDLEGDELEVTMDFSDFGKPVDAEVPGVGQTQELTDVLFRLQEQLLG